MSLFIIPMAGLSSRFFKAGYTKPKYQLMLKDESIFSWSVRSFEKYFETDTFIFVYRDIYNTKEFIEKEISHLGIKNFHLVCLDKETLGQADTVYQGLKHIEADDEVYIFNIDSKIINFIKPKWVNSCDGYLEVFKGEGDHWSFALAEENTLKVIKTAEKERISDFCSDGLYYFSKKSLFENAFLKAKVKEEFYIAPLYNTLIRENNTILYDLINIENILFCGTPEEYLDILEKQK